MSDEEPQIIWENTVDHGTWHCKVVRTGDYTGRLTVSRMIPDGETILDEEVTLSFRAVFGPDVSDLGLWQDKVLAAIDSQPGYEPPGD